MIKKAVLTLSISFLRINICLGYINFNQSKIYICYSVRVLSSSSIIGTNVLLWLIDILRAFFNIGV